MDITQVREAPVYEKYPNGQYDYTKPFIGYSQGVFANLHKDLTSDSQGVKEQDDKLLTLLTGGVNSAMPSQSGFPNVNNNTYPASLTFGGSNNKQGVLWSNDANMLDLTKSQTFSFWINSSYTTMEGGIAFVLQNDPNEIQALSTVTNNSALSLAPQETLGVWASDTGNLLHTSGAIQNSWALEIDNDVNNLGSINNSFDMGLTPGKAHIITGYPGKESSYTKLSNGAYQLNQSNPDYHLLGGEGSGYYWHHLVVMYNPNSDGKTAEITYKFNDILENGKKNNNTGTETITNPIESSRHETINLKNTFNLADSQKKIRWGLVGYGNATMTSVTLENISTLLDADITSQVLDNTQNKTLNDENNYVNAGDSVTLRYNLKYTDGQSDWDRIFANINIPQGLTVTGGTITYANGVKELLSSSEVSDGKFGHLMSSALNKSNDTAVVDINTVAPTLVTKDTDVKGETATFEGNSYVGSTTTQDFVIRNNVTKKLNISSTSPSYISIEKSKEATINGSLEYGDGSDFDDYGADLYVSVNGENQEPVQITTNNDKAKIDFGQVLSGSNLNTGDNVVKMYAKDSYGNTSETLTFTINVTDKYANVEASPKFEFNDMNSTYVGTVKRKGDWNVVVTTANSPWELTASATKLTGNNGDNFSGSIVYKDGDSVQTMQDQTVKIGGSTEPQTGTIDIEKDFWKNNSDEGILLQSTDGTKISDNYTGVITWNLTDAPENN
ncbi:hypothetical protein [Companilactobacillus hulinensis]|uniref:hypothetical protein n=1 Tax=Companilactobacillus hulinensis TaxID=2486007 RepID=UPI000F7B9C4E|nr:hypothetical protein [Companilactobacillus hulinensis]